MNKQAKYALAIAIVSGCGDGWDVAITTTGGGDAGEDEGSSESGTDPGATSTSGGSVDGSTGGNSTGSDGDSTGETTSAEEADSTGDDVCMITHAGCMCDGVVVDLSVCECAFDPTGVCTCLGLSTSDEWCEPVCETVKGLCLCNGMESDPSECGCSIGESLDGYTCACDSPSGPAPSDPTLCGCAINRAGECICDYDGMTYPAESCG